MFSWCVGGPGSDPNIDTGRKEREREWGGERREEGRRLDDLGLLIESLDT